jgi:flagellar basal body-associated protein FliL
MSKYFVVLGVTIFVFIIIFLLLSYISPFNLSQQKKEPESTPPSSTLYFKPSIITSSCLSSSYEVPIYLSSKNNYLNSAQIELSYDPEIIHSVRLTPTSPNFFGESTDYSILLEETREQYGRASLALELKNQSTEKKGNNKVALLTFTIISPLSAGTYTIHFLNKSSLGSQKTPSSLLVKTTPLTIYCKEESNNMSTPSSQLIANPIQ